MSSSTAAIPSASLIGAGTNANLYPHVGDYALIGIEGNTVAHSGFFDGRWK